jgi:hypothetical protein
MFTLKLKNIVSRRITESGKFQTFSGKIEIKAQPIDLFNWIKFRGPILMVWSSLQNFRFVGLSIGSNSTGQVFPLEPHFEATRNFPGPKKIPRAYIDLLNLCAKFYPKILTLSASNPQAKNPPKGIVWTWLFYLQNDQMVFFYFLLFIMNKIWNIRFAAEEILFIVHGMFLKGVYKIESDTKTEYEGF